MQRIWLTLSSLEVIFLIFLPYAYSIDERVINGTVATNVEAGYTISLRLRRADYKLFGSGHFCGGSLVKRNVVMTAAHCVLDEDNRGRLTIPQKARDLHVVLGIVNRYSIDDNTIILNVLKIVPHEGFESAAQVNDIALVFLVEPVPIGHPVVRPVSPNRVQLPPNTRCVLSGWGYINKTRFIMPFNLMRVSLSILDLHYCRHADKNKRMPDEIICAGYAQEGDGGSCSGDSGGPLLCNNVVAGVVSFGASNCDTRKFGFFANVSHYTSWLDKHLNNEVKSQTKEVENSTSRSDVGFSTIVLITGNFVFCNFVIL